MEFSVLSFSNNLYNYLLDSSMFPYMKDEELDRSKHGKRNPLHLRQAIRQVGTVMGNSDDKAFFEIGTGMLETTHPYYHILQNSYSIRKRGKGTKKTKGSQDKVENKAMRDYERVSWNGKTFTKEYTRNVRGMRKPKNMTVFGENFIMNSDASSYQNTHYKYIDKILDQEVVDRLALEFGLKKPIKRDTGLGDEYEMQRMIDMFGSHDII